MNPTLSAPPVERSARINRALVSALLAKVPDYVHFKDRDSRFIAVSNSLVRYVGRSHADELLGRTDNDFFVDARARQTLETEQRILRTGQPVVGKLEQEVRRDGQTAWVVSNRLPLKDEQGVIIGTFGISKDVTRTRQMEADLEQAHLQLVDASRTAGMAEVATGVLHNVGNVLNSLNVSASVIATGLRQSKADSLARVGDLLREHQPGLAHFLTHDPKGKRVPEFLASLARHAAEERDRMLQEISALQKNIDHIKEIVAMQQAYATMVGVVESLDPVALMEDALRMNAAALVRHEVHATRDFLPTPPVLGERAKILQILVNLIRNAKYACDEAGVADKRVTVKVATAAAPDRVQLIVQDTGIGIPAANLTRIFQHGFTTRVNGHGFGLHSSANAAREMKGSLTAHSDGVGRGATFTLELPVAPPTKASS
jgi:PAS domain S-box-containing protein